MFMYATWDTIAGGPPRASTTNFPSAGDPICFSCDGCGFLLSVGSTGRRRKISPAAGQMITRSKLVEQLREYQIRSQHKWAFLASFSPKPQITSRKDVLVALSYAFLCCLLIVSICVMLYYRLFRASVVIICLSILLLTWLKVSRQKALAKKRERRLLLPLHM